MNDTAMKNRLFTDRMFKSLFFPSLISAVGLALGDTADALFVGIKLGQTGLAVMSLVVPIYFIFNVIICGLAIGTSVEYTHCMGRGKARDGICVFSQMTFVTLALSVLIMATGFLFMPQILKILGAGSPDTELWQYTEEYLRLMFLGTPVTFLYFLFYYSIRCDGGEKLASIGYLTGYSSDVLASAVFILGFGWDIKGAILATLLGKIVGVAIFSTWIIRKNSILRIIPTKIDPKRVFQIYKTGFSSSVGFLFQFITALVVNNLLIRLDGENAVAEYNIIQNVSYLALAIFSALGDTIQPLVGTFYAEHDNDGMKRVMELSKRIGVIAGVASVLFFCFAASGVCRLFGLPENLVSSGSYAVRLYCLAVIPAGINILYSSSYQAVKRQKEVFLINFLRSFAVNLSVAFLLYYCGIRFFWLWFAVNEIISFFVWAPISHKYSVKIQKKAESQVVSCLFDSTNNNLGEVIEKFEAFCENHGANMKQSYYVTMCLEEVCQAIIENAFKGNGDEYIQASLVCEKDGEFILYITDNAWNFNPFTMKNDKNYLDSEEDVASMGIQMVKTKAKSFFYRRYNGFNTMVVEV